MSWLQWWFHRGIHMSKLIKLCTFKNTSGKQFFKKSLLKPFTVRFPSVSWPDPFLQSEFRAKGGRKNDLHSSLKAPPQAGPVGLHGPSSSRALRRPCLLSQQLWHRRLWLVLRGFELKWPQKEQHLQKWGLGKVAPEEETKSKNLTAEVTCQIPNLNTKSAF